MEKQIFEIGSIEKRHDDTRNAYFDGELEVLDGIDISDGEKPGASSLSETEIKKLRALGTDAWTEVLDRASTSVEVIIKVEDESSEGYPVSVDVLSSE